MTLRLPLLTQDKESIREWNDSQRDLVHQRIAYCYANNPSVSLSIVSSGGNISPSMTDTRYQAGSYITRVDRFATEAETSEPSIVTGTTYDKVSQTRTDPDIDWGETTYPGHWKAKPVYYEGYANGKYAIREMSFQDVLDTFIDPVVANIVSGTTDAKAGGSYHISTASSQTNCTNLGTVFVDTKANVGAYSASQIPETRDQPTTVATFRLFRNNGVEADFRLPLVVDYNNYFNLKPNKKGLTVSGLREMTQAEFQEFFCPLIRQQIYNGTGNTLNFNFNGSGTTKGTAITNKRLSNVTGNYQTRYVNTNDYRAQEFPNGTLINANTWRLKLNRT